MRLRSVLTAALAPWVILAGCAEPTYAAPDLPEPAKDLPAAGPAEKSRTAVFAAGCFWCVEAVFEELAGVSEVVSGYAGGTKETAVYERVSSGATSHAEAVRVTYDPAKITYAQLLHVLFSTHDPTTKDRQGPDHGKQYRSAVFFDGPEQKSVAEAYVAQLERAKVFPAAIVTTIEKLDAFYPAEAYHQDFVARNPEHPYVRAWSVPKQKKLKERFPGLLARKPAPPKG